jgi:hypothetical protein
MALREIIEKKVLFVNFFKMLVLSKESLDFNPKL